MRTERRRHLIPLTLFLGVLAGCISNASLVLPPAPPPADWAELGGDPATAYDCLLQSARAFERSPDHPVTEDSAAWRLRVGQEDRLRLQVAALRADAFDSVGLDLGTRGFRVLFGATHEAGDLTERVRLADGRTAWQETVEVTLQASIKGTWTVAGSLVPRGGGGALDCAPAEVTVR